MRTTSADRPVCASPQTGAHGHEGSRFSHEIGRDTTNAGRPVCASPTQGRHGHEGSRFAGENRMRPPLADRLLTYRCADPPSQGRTGMTGRGLLGHFGPNHAADPIVTRWKTLVRPLHKSSRSTAGLSQSTAELSLSTAKLRQSTVTCSQSTADLLRSSTARPSW